MSCVAAVVVSWSLFSIWPGVQREAYIQHNGADGSWRFVLGIQKPLSLVVDGMVMPGWTHENMPGSDIQLCQCVTWLAHLLVGVLVIWQNLNTTGQTVKSGSSSLYLILLLQLAALSSLCFIEYLGILVIVLQVIDACIYSCGTVITVHRF